MLTNGLNMGFLLKLNWKDSLWSKNICFPIKKKIPIVAISKRGNANSLLGYGKTHHYFLEIASTVKSAFPQLIRQNSTCLLNYPRISHRQSRWYVYKLRKCRGCPRGVMVKAMDFGIVVREFVLQSRYYVHFRANTLGKSMNPLILQAMG